MEAVACGVLLFCTWLVEFISGRHGQLPTEMSTSGLCRQMRMERKESHHFGMVCHRPEHDALLTN